MPLGSPITNKFSIGTAELRIGPLTSANKLLPSHSLGLIDSASLNVEQEAAELEGGFPRKLVDTAIIRQSASISATLREYSRKNIFTMLGEGATIATTDFATTVATQAAADATSLEVFAGAGANFSAGDLITLYNAGSPENVSVVRVESVATDTLTLDAGTPLLFQYEVGDPIFISAEVPVGAVTRTNYFSVALIQKENATGRPTVWSFWKGAIASGLSLDTNAEDFASTEIEINLLEPAASEFGAGGDLNHLANIIPSNPIGLYAAGGDVYA